MVDKKITGFCNSILSEISQEITKEKSDFIQLELKKSSTYNLAHLVNVAESKKYLTEDQIENLKIYHINFLRDEFFNIIKTIYTQNKIHLIFQDNQQILQDQIKFDTDDFISIFEEHKKIIEIKKKQNIQLKLKKEQIIQ